jgi:hypothetical protein
MKLLLPEAQLQESRNRMATWTNGVPRWVLKMTPEEMYVAGFYSGYRCGKSDAQMPIADFEFEQVKE